VSDTGPMGLLSFVCNLLKQNLSQTKIDAELGIIFNVLILKYTHISDAVVAL